MSKNVTVYPVPDRWLQGVPATVQTVEPKEAEELIASGAFTDEHPGKPAVKVPAEPEPEPA